MCGLTIFYNAPNYPEYIHDLKEFIKNRGPDHLSYNKIEDLHCIFSRLAIQDISENGHQPFISKSKKFFILFNGEIYNHLEIRNQISKEFSKDDWKSTSDTETLIESFDLYGVEKTLKIIEGMFSIFLYEFEKKKVTLVNDVFGQKPLYYQIEKNYFVISSSLNSFKFLKNKINHESISSLLKNNYIEHEKTIYMSVKKLKPASYIQFHINGSFNDTKEKIFYDKAKKFHNLNLSYDEIKKSLKQKLFDSVEQQLISDVPIGTFLSGGIDSSLITSIASKIHTKKIDTFTIGFENIKFDEAIHAKRIADYLGTNHHENYLNQNNINEILDNVFDAYDEPFSDSSQIPSLLLCRFSSKKIKVCLSGDGGDELFGGYNRYVFNVKLWNFINKFPFIFRSGIRKLFLSNLNFFLKPTIFLAQILNKRFKNVHYFDQKLIKLFDSINAKDLFNFSNKFLSHANDELLDKLLISKIEYEENNHSYEQNTEGLMNKDIHEYLSGDLLVKMDRASMFYGLEVRSPFLNKDIFEFANQIPLKYKINGQNSKIIIKDILSDFLPKNLFERPKQGFLIPLHQILTDTLFNKKFNKLFEKEKIIKQNIFDSKTIFSLVSSFQNGNYFNQYLLWDIICLQKWLDKNLEH